MLNLFLALLINAFASDNLKSAKDNDEDNKMILAFRRIKELFCCCLSKKSSVKPDELDEGMELSDVESINVDGKHSLYYTLLNICSHQLGLAMLVWNGLNYI